MEVKQPRIEVDGDCSSTKRQQLELLCRFCGLDGIKYVDRHMEKGEETYILLKGMERLELIVSTDHRDAIARLFIQTPIF